MTEILKTVKSVRAFHNNLRPQKWALVPTMGNLHDGHLSLIKIAQAHADKVIVSIFVNPTQFGPNEDLDSYPRTFEADLEKLQAAGVDAVFYPTETVIYPDGRDSTLSIEMPTSMTNILCGLDRPTHFQGVATVVAKLFQIVHPDVAVFGEKDFQQLAIIRRLNRELFMNIQIIGAPIIRESNGLAMSSRNQYLSDAGRKQAGYLSQTLQWCREQMLQGRAPEIVIEQGKQRLAEQQIPIEYLDFRDRETLLENPEVSAGVLLLAARIGTTRLIDNLRIEAIL